MAHDLPKDGQHPQKEGETIKTKNMDYRSIKHPNYDLNDFDNIPVRIYHLETNELIGEFPTVKKAANELIGLWSGRGSIHKSLKKPKTRNGKMSFFRIRDGRKCYAVKIATAA